MRGVGNSFFNGTFSKRGGGLFICRYENRRGKKTLVQRKKKRISRFAEQPRALQNTTDTALDGIVWSMSDDLRRRIYQTLPSETRRFIDSLCSQPNIGGVRRGKGALSG